MIEYLSAILRYGVSSGSEPVRLRDEIKQLEDYASLHNLRSDAKVELRVFIPPELAGPGDHPAALPAAGGKLHPARLD